MGSGKNLPRHNPNNLPTLQLQQWGGGRLVGGEQLDQGQADRTHVQEGIGIGLGLLGL